MHSSIGVANVQDRIMLYFEEGYRISHQQWGMNKGFVVHIVLPVMDGGDLLIRGEGLAGFGSWSLILAVKSVSICEHL